MIDFVFGVLGSLIFWAAYTMVSSFISTALLKHMAKETFSFLVGGDEHRTKTEGPCRSNNYASETHPYICYTFIAIFYFLMWPVVLLFVSLRFIIPNVVLPIFRKMVITVDKMTPTIKFEKKEKTNGKDI